MTKQRIAVRGAWEPGRRRSAPVFCLLLARLGNMLQRSKSSAKKAGSRSRSMLAFTTTSCRPSVGAAARRSAMADGVAGNAGSARTPNRAALGINSRSNCNFFGANSAVKLALPVAFAPGRLRLTTRPNATGSPPVVKTIGMVVVAAFAASAAGVLAATSTATRRRTRSAASAGSRSY